MKLRLVSTDKIEQYLFHHHFSEKENASVFAEYAQGSIGKAIEIATSGNIFYYERRYYTKNCFLFLNKMMIYQKHFLWRKN